MTKPPAWKERVDRERDAEAQGRTTRTVHIGGTYVYLPRAGRERYGQTCRVVKTSKPSVRHKSALIEFEDGHRQRVPTRHLQRDVYRVKSGVPDVPGTLYDDARARPTYRSLVQLAVQHHGTDSLEVPARITAVCGRLARTVAPQHDPTIQAALAAALDTAVRAEAAELHARRAARAKPPERVDVPEQLKAVNWARLDAEARDEINLIARAIAHEYTVPTVEEEQPEQPAREPKADALEQLMRDEGRAAIHTAKLAVRYLLDEDDPDLAREYAHASREHEGRHLDIARFLGREAERKRPQRGRFHRGVIFEIRKRKTIEYQDVDGKQVRETVYERRYFTLVVVWNEDGHTLEIANGREIERVSGTLVGEDGWRDLARWIEQHDRRLAGNVPGRPPTSNRDLIFRRAGEGATRTRESVLDDFPGAIRALEALRSTLGSKPREDLGNLTTFQPEELEWTDDEDFSP